MPALKQAGNKLSFRQVYSDHKDGIYTFVLFRVGHDRDVAEDVVSDVFLKAYRSFDSYDSRYAITTWLYTITKNTLIDHYRKGRSVVDIDDLPVADDRDPLYRLVTEGVNEREVHEAIAALPEQQQHVIKEQFFAGKTAKEVGAELNLSHAAVRKQVSRAVAALREALLGLTIITSEFARFII